MLRRKKKIDKRQKTKENFRKAMKDYARTEKVSKSLINDA